MRRILALGLAFAAAAWLGGSDSYAATPRSPIAIAYVKPKEAAHEAIYQKLKAERILERIRDRFSGWQIPRPMTIKVEECGEINAAYEPSDTTLTICYEYLAYIQELAHDIPPAGALEGLTPANYVLGPFLEVVLHELAHAVFDLKKVPILGREEDAADQVATYVLLLLGKEEARRVISSLAVMYAGEAKDTPPALKDFADEHGVPAQRFFNLLCMSYGADAKTFAFVVEKNYLPKARAELCKDEYLQVKFAIDRLVIPALKGIRNPLQQRTAPISRATAKAK